MESKVQSKLIKRLESEGWYVVRLIMTNKNGIPDLLCMHHAHGVKFIEVKDVKGTISVLQTFRMKEITEKTGIKCEVFRTDYKT